MSIQAPALIKKSTPVLVEGIFIFLIAIVIVANTTTTDIVLHDNYVLPIISECFPENQSDFCTTIRQNMGLPSNAQLDIGNIYWNELARQALFIGVILFLIRIAIGYFLQIQGVRRVRLSTYLMAIFWGLAGSALFLFGFLDLLYFAGDVIGGGSIPNELAWLNNAGLFQETRSFTGDPNIVEVEDLILTNILGLVVIFSFLFVVMLVYSQNGQARRGIA